MSDDKPHRRLKEKNFRGKTIDKTKAEAKQTRLSARSKSHHHDEKEIDE